MATTTTLGYEKRSWRFSRQMVYLGIPHGIPLIGSITAGRPIEAVENWKAGLAISPDLFGCKNCFDLRVRRGSMIDAHIMDGDLAIIRPQPRVEKKGGDCRRTGA